MILNLKNKNATHSMLCQIVVGGNLRHIQLLLTCRADTFSLALKKQMASVVVKQ